jgi:hypothetical protein
LFDVAHARNSAATKAQIEQIGFELRRFCAGE